MLLGRCVAALSTAALLVACSAHKVEVLTAPSASPTAEPSAELTAEPSAGPTAEPTAGPTPVQATTPPPRPVVTKAPAPPTRAPTQSPTPKATPVDSRPRATVQVLNHASMTIDATVGDAHFHLRPEASSAKTSTHVDPAGNTGVEVHRSDAASCGQGDVDDLLAGHTYVVAITDGSGCTVAGAQLASPVLKLSPS